MSMSIRRTSDPRLPHVVILGAGYAGTLAALRLAARVRSGPRARVTLVNAVPHFVERVRLHQLAAGQTLTHRPLESILRGSGVELCIGHVQELDAAAHRLRLTTASGEARSLPWDYLLYAAGSGQGRADVPGVREHAYGIASEADARRLAAAVRALPAGSRVVVVGGGLTGLEAASELAETFPALRVQLVSAGPVGPGLSERGRAYVRDTLRALGIELREHSPVIAVEPGALTLTGGTVPFDAAVWCGGFLPSPLAAAAGLRHNAAGQLVVGADLRALDQPEIFGCGDGAGFADGAHGLRMSCAVAMPMAAQAADNLAAVIAGRTPQPHGFAYAAQCLSLGRRAGIVQRVGADDAPRPLIVTGRIGARLKEVVCRYTMVALSIERYVGGTYTWPGRDRAGLAATPGTLVA